MSTVGVQYRLPWTTPPLTMNSRANRFEVARKTKEMRRTAWAYTRAAKIPAGLQHCTVTLTYHPRDSRVRDADNLMPVLKAVCDGIVDAKVVPDDTPRWMTKQMPVIEEPSRTDPRLVVKIEWATTSGT